MADFGALRGASGVMWSQIEELCLFFIHTWSTDAGFDGSGALGEQSTKFSSVTLNRISSPGSMKRSWCCVLPSSSSVGYSQTHTCTLHMYQLFRCKHISKACLDFSHHKNTDIRCQEGTYVQCYRYNGPWILRTLSAAIKRCFESRECTKSRWIYNMDPDLFPST